MGIFSKRRKSKEDPIQREEREIIKRCIKPGDVVFDIGAHHGLWSEAVLDRHGKAELHVFEASSSSFANVNEQLAGRATVNHFAMSNRVGEVTFHTYHDDARLSSIYRRESVEDQILPGGFISETVPATTVDTYWQGQRRQINFLKVDVEGAEYDVLRGANRMLKEGKIDYLQFEYGGTFHDANVTLQNVWSFLRRSGYRIYSVKGREFSEMKKFTKANENYQYSNYIAVNERLVSLFTGKTEDITLYTGEMERHGISLRGVLQVGAHEGQEVETFRKLKLDPIVLVEANPKLASALREKYADSADVTVIEGAASDKEGTAEFNLASMDQSSSLLASAKHSDLYPKITFDEKIKVQTFRLDQALSDAGIDVSRLNLLVMDIQGAELMALRGATNILPHVDAIQLEVNFDELYEGCPLIYDLDDFLDAAGFLRVLTRTPYSADWGDGLYVRRPVVTHSKLGEMGRFANQAFQYMFLRAYGEEQQYDSVNPVWIGDQLFHTRPGTTDVPKLPFLAEQKGLRLKDCNIANSPVTFPNTDIQGFFQYDMRYYAPYRDLLLKELSFRAPYDGMLDQIRQVFASSPGPVAAIHLRREDYGYGSFFIPPNAWYVEWLETLRRDHPNLKLYIATDSAESAGSDFDAFDRILASDLNLPDHEVDFFADFAALSCADFVGVANSSFSFLASILNSQARGFARPDLTEKKMIPFDPWTSEPLLYEKTAEEAGGEFMSERGKSRSKYRIRKFFGLYK